MPHATTPVPVHEPERERFSITEDGQRAVVEYAIAGQVMTVHHTRVPEAIGGRGIAGILVRAALDHARNHGLKVRPTCSYADAWMRRHPEYEDLRTP